MKEFLFTSNGLKNINSLPYGEEDLFTFAVGRETAKCSKYTAAFLSPTITKLLKEDISFSSFSITTESEDMTLFQQILDGESISLVPENLQFLKDVGAALNNEELINAVQEAEQETNQDEQITTTNVLSEIVRCYNLGQDVSAKISFAAKQISQVNRAQLVQMDPTILDYILSDQELLVENEDWLIELIEDSVMYNGKKATFLFKNVAFEYISSGCMEHFIKNFSCEQMSAPVWNAICGRLKHDVVPSTLYVDRYFKDFQQQDAGEDKNVTKYEYIGSPFEGIFNSLASQCQKNPHLADVVEVTASSKERSNPYKLLDYDWRGWFYTRNEPDSFIQFDFKDKLVCPTWYSIRTDGNNCSHIKSWVLEGTNDLSAWKEIDRRVNQENMNNDFAVGTYKCAKTRFFRYLRIRQIDENTSGNNYLGLCNFEVFGDVKQVFI